MIEFLKVIDEEPFLLFKNYYDKAIINNQKRAFMQFLSLHILKRIKRFTQGL